jgi:hypothetical protein
MCLAARSPSGPKPTHTGNLYQTAYGEKTARTKAQEGKPVEDFYVFNIAQIFG